MADTSTGHGDLITGSLRPTDDIPASDKKPLRLTKAEPAPAAKAAAAIPEARYRVQLGAFREEQLAQRAWEEISRDAVPLVGQSSPAIQKADLGERGKHHPPDNREYVHALPPLSFAPPEMYRRMYRLPSAVSIS